MAKSNLIKLAKGTTKKAEPAKKAEKKEVEKPLTPAEERDLKAKAKVEELLQDVSLVPQSKEEDKGDETLIELDEVKGTDWLTEQVTALNAENDLLKADLAIAKEDYRRIFEENQRIKSGAGISDDGEIKTKVVELFNELQNNYISMGVNQMTGAPNFIIRPVGFMNRMIVFFPFLQKIKKF